MSRMEVMVCTDEHWCRETLLYALPYIFFFSYRIYLSQLLVSVAASIVFLFLSLIGSSDSSFLWCWLWLTGKLLSAGLENSLLFPVKAAYQENVLNFIKSFSSNYCDNHVFFFSIYSNYQISKFLGSSSLKLPVYMMFYCLNELPRWRYW